MKLKTKDMLDDTELARGKMYNVMYQSSCDFATSIKGRLDGYDLESIVLDVSTQYNSELKRIQYKVMHNIQVVE